MNNTLHQKYENTERKLSKIESWIHLVKSHERLSLFIGVNGIVPLQHDNFSHFNISCLTTDQNSKQSVPVDDPFNQTLPFFP